MPRRFNFTGRQRVLRADSRIHLSQEGGTTSFSSELSFADYDLPDEARVTVEAYRQSSRMHFPHGSIAVPQHPVATQLSEFGSSEGVLFRVRVTAVGEHRGMLLAVADRIRPDPPGTPSQAPPSLLPIRPGTLDGEVWKVEFDPAPCLIVDPRHGDIHAVARAPAFFSLVYPVVLRIVLTHLFHIDNGFDDEDETAWQVQWLALAQHMPGVGQLPDREDVGENVDEWIDDVVAAFGRKLGMHDHFARFWSQGEGE